MHIFPGGDDVDAADRDLQIDFVPNVASNQLAHDGPYCGDTIVQDGEECDDGNRTDTDACRNTCFYPRCGDRVVSMTEECEDGNTESGDGCSADCLIEGGVRVKSVVIDRSGNSLLGSVITNADGSTLDEVRTVATSRAPAGKTGPAALVVMASGASAGWAWVRRRRAKQS